MSCSYQPAQVLYFYGSRIRARSKVSREILDDEGLLERKKVTRCQCGA
jgi:hypothetical protein